MHHGTVQLENGNVRITNALKGTGFVITILSLAMMDQMKIQKCVSIGTALQTNGSAWIINVSIKS